MKLLLCLKQVPDTEVKVQESFDFLKENTILNPEDEFALEQMNLIKDRFQEILAIRVGPLYPQDVLYKALALGAHKAHLIEASPYLNSYETAQSIFDYLNSIGFKPDLILTGKNSIDMNYHSTPQVLSALFNISFIGKVVSFQFQNEKILLKSQTDLLYEIEASLPLCLSCFKGLNQPKMIPLPKLMAAKKMAITKSQSTFQGTKPQLHLPQEQKKGWIRTFESKTQVEELFIELKKDKLL